MKFLIGAAVASVLLMGAAMAQTTTPATPATPAAPVVVPPSACPALDQPPAVPDAATATRNQMREADTAYQTWAHAYQASLVCRRNEVEQHRAVDDAMRAQFNTQAALLNTTTASWTAAVAAFNTRSGGQQQSHPTR